jgi:hypothetical protein
LKIDAQVKATEFFKAKELEVHALLASADGGLFVATSPDGKVYRVDAAGAATVYFDPDDKYIWSLATDAQGRLYVGTGEKGVIYRVGSAGKSEIFCKTETKHVTSLAFGRSGEFFASTDSPGRVLRIDAAGRFFALLDSSFKEMRALRIGADGSIYAAAVGGKASGGDDRPSVPPVIDAPKPAAGVAVSTDVTFTIADMSPSVSPVGSPASRATDKSSVKGAVYRIDPDGNADTMWESKDDAPFDITLETDGAVTIATGNGGKLYRVAGDPAHTTLLARLPGQQITAMLVMGSARYCATSNPAKIVLLPGARANEGTYLSEVKDAGMVATWGTLSWRGLASGAGRLQMYTRTGNTNAPDESWTPWAGPYTAADGDAVKNASARYLQWKAVISATPTEKDSPALVSVKVGYRQRNARPHVTSISVMPPGVVYQKPYPTGEADIAGFGESQADAKVPVYSLPLGSAPPPSPESGPSLGRRIYQKGLQAFTWKADDANDDRLVYDVFYRRVESAMWVPMPLRRQSSEQLVTWDTTAVPDGTYQIKVVASDQPDNSRGQQLTAALESEAFDVDNTPPTIAVTKLSRDASLAQIVIEVRDTQSAVERVEYSVNAGPWQPLFAVDGIGDSRQSRYALSVDAGMLGRVVVRASDAMNNIGTFTVERPDAPAAKAGAPIR